LTEAVYQKFLSHVHFQKKDKYARLEGQPIKDGSETKPEFAHTSSHRINEDMSPLASFNDHVAIRIWEGDLSIGVMTATLDDVVCLLHLPITNRMLDHILIRRGEVVELLVEFIISDPEEAILDQECHSTKALKCDSVGSVTSTRSS
ncbi:hypothetical protein A2U01_0019315, partial [Trifolium medium]|nr:hypothetical protein [Trifolium medium]